MTGRALLVFVLATCVPAVSGAQVLERPQRARPPRSEPNSKRQVTLVATTLGSYDDNLTAGQTIGDPEIPSQSGYTGFADASLRLDQTSGSKVFDVVGRGYVNAFRNVGLTPMYGADAEGHFGAGTRHRFDVRQAIRSEPFYNIGGFAAFRYAADPATLPDENPLHGSSARRSWAAASRMDFTSQWSARNTLGVSLGYDTREYTDRVGDTHGGTGSLFYGRNVGRRSRLRLSYGYADSQLLEPVIGWTPLQTQSAEGGLELERAFSPTRRLLVSFGAGAVRAFTRERLTREESRAWVPAGYGTMWINWARTWSLSADYRRSVGSVQGISGDAFTTDAGLVRVGGFVARPLELTLSAAYAEGQASMGVPGSYDTYTSTAQLRLQLSPTWSALVSHDLYQYAIRNVDPILRRLPTNVNRNAIRVGLSMDLPLVGRERIDRRARD
jgi:hypothetical protein